MPERALHLVGGTPGGTALALSPEEQMRSLVDQVDLQRLTSLPWAAKPTWLVAYVSAHRRAATVGVHPDTSFLAAAPNLDPTPPRHRPIPSRVELCGYEDIAELAAATRRIREATGATDVRLQIPVPNPLDLAAYVTELPPPRSHGAALLRAATRRIAFRVQVLDAVHALEKAYPGELLFRVQMPWTPTAVLLTPYESRRVAAAVVVDQVGKFVTSCPPSARLVLEPAYVPAEAGFVGLGRHLRFITRLARATARKIRRRNRFLHTQQALPALLVATGSSGHKRTDATYAPLRRLPSDMPVYAGVVDHDLADARTPLHGIERAIDRPAAAVSTTQSLTQWSPSTAERALANLLALADSYP
jgi:hypothetical protein